MSEQNVLRNADREAWLAPLQRPGRDARSSSNASSIGGATRAGQVVFAPTSAIPGSFSTDLKSPAASRKDPSEPEIGAFRGFRPVRRDDRDDQQETDRRLAKYRDEIDKEIKIKVGSENLLEALNAKSAKQTREQRAKVESELNISNKKIAQLRQDLELELHRSKDRSPSPAGRLSQLFRNLPPRSPSRHADSPLATPYMDSDNESPTFVLAELLQSLETQGLAPDYYVEKANSLVDLLKRHSGLKRDLVWSIFGLRMQVMLLNDNREIVAAAFRVLRHAITNRKSLSIIRSFHTDELVILSLVKDSKISTQREQALKFVRSFLDVEGGLEEISVAVVRIVVAIAEYHEDRMRGICILTLAEMLIRAPNIVIAAGGIRVLCEAISDGSFEPADGLVAAFLFLLECPSRRKYLRSGHELKGPFAIFTDGMAASEARLRVNAKVISALLKTWSGITALSQGTFVTIRSLISSLYMSTIHRDVLLDLFFDVLRITPPSWSNSFLAGRRLTTYNRVNMKLERSPEQLEREKHTSTQGGDLVKHFTATILAVLLHSGLIASLIFTLQNEGDPSVKRKACLLLGEVLNMAHELLPTTWNQKMQVLPKLLAAAAALESEDRGIASGVIYQVDSVNRTLYRTGRSTSVGRVEVNSASRPSPIMRRPSDLNKGDLTPQIEEGQFRAVILETQVLNTVNFAKWRWDMIEKIITGPLLNPKRLEEATKANKFVKRVMGFYLPFKYRFSAIRNTRPNHRYIRIGCALFETLMQSAVGVAYLAEHKLLRQIAECLAQVDRLSGLTSNAPIFSEDGLSESLVGGYFAMLGVMSRYPKGLQIMERLRMANMFYHIVELEVRNDLIKVLLGQVDYALDSHLRVILSKSMTSCDVDVRVYSTRLLRRYATGKAALVDQTMPNQSCTEWAIDLLITQLYDPEVEVSEVAVRILEEACNDIASLEYVVRCRPILDHLGEIGAPLLLRFLSTSVGYHYLDGLDYISQEMDDWFLGRNDTYVLLVEASLAKGMAGSIETAQSPNNDEIPEGLANHDVAPPHFYRELTRTEEGCRLLQRKGHFEDFVNTIRLNGGNCEDAEIMLRVKGCLWAVGNIGSMELGAPFLDGIDVVEQIIKIALQSESFSMRGTAFLVLGLISGSIFGQEILAEHGWDIAINDFGQSTGICFPTDLRKLFSVPRLENAEGGANFQHREKEAEFRPPVFDEDATNDRILQLIKDLGNTPLTKKRAGELHSIKARKVPGFHSPRLFRKVMTILEQHHFRLPVLRFVIDLFDKSVLRRILLDEDDDSDNDSTVMNDSKELPPKG